MKTLHHHFLKNYNNPYEKCDENGLFQSCLYPSSINKLFFKTSWFSLFTGLYALKQKHYDLVIVPLSVWFTSILYWYNPIYTSWRRTLDITVVRSALIYQLWMARNAENRIMFYSTACICCASYPVTFYFISKKLHWLAAFSHGFFVHFLGNIANVILYKGQLN